MCPQHRKQAEKAGTLRESGRLVRSSLTGSVRHLPKGQLVHTEDVDWEGWQMWTGQHGFVGGFPG